MKLIIPSCLFILAVTRCTMIFATCIGGPTWSRTSPDRSWSATLVVELKQIICVLQDICSPFPFLFGNGKISPWTLWWVYPAPLRAMILFRSLWRGRRPQSYWSRAHQRHRAGSGACWVFSPKKPSQYSACLQTLSLCYFPCPANKNLAPASYSQQPTMAVLRTVISCAIIGRRVCLRWRSIRTDTEVPFGTSSIRKGHNKKTVTATIYSESLAIHI